MGNRLQELHDAGQSIWYDNIRRGLLVSGEMQRMVDEDWITGLTANPTIFEKAITGSSDYDPAIAELAAQGLPALQIYERLATDDVRQVADILRPVYDRTNGADGFVSLEVSPALAFDTAGTIAEAKRLWSAVDRPNLMIKIPGTEAGVPAIEESLASGLNINITLLFSVAAYEKVMEAYLRGLERRAANQLAIDRIASVASFFVSRIDTLVDKLLDAKLTETLSTAAKETNRKLHGQVAVASAQIAYQRFRDTFSTDRFARLAQRGARVQRPLWASTSTKNPAYSDLLYVESLIGPDTVDTMPPQTIVAFRDHGRVERTVDRDPAWARAVMDDLQAAGIDINAATEQILQEGVKSFSDSFSEIETGIDKKVAELGAETSESQRLRLFDFEHAVNQQIELLRDENFVRRAWEHDPTAWTPDENAALSIKSRLGWLDVTTNMIEQVPSILELVESVRVEGFDRALLLGMGGSSLCPEVFRTTFGVRDGYLDLKVLDSTDPRAVRDCAREVDPARTLFIVSSKSGTTTEPNDFFRYFWAMVQAVKGKRAGESFIAITDPGTPLADLAADRGFRRTFLNPPDIGGRYSALSYFGIVPAALMGIDIGVVLSRAQRMEQSCVPVVPIERNPGVRLGATLAALAKTGRDKVTFVCSPEIGSLGLWLEQLLAESTGKAGTGLIPVASEPLGAPDDYGSDRLFVYMRLTDRPDESQDRGLDALDAVREPQVRISLDDPLDLGQEFFRWEMATATAGSILKINPFDEPNVQESKDNTVSLLKNFELFRTLPQPKPNLHSHGVSLSSNRTVPISGIGDGLAEALHGYFAEVRPGDYVALMAYIAPTEEHLRIFQRMRFKIRNVLKVPTTLGFGPRFLHSTGQLHKGGPDSGVFIQVTGIDGPDLEIPGESYGFQTLIDAQALGDLRSLEQHGRRVIRLDLRDDVASGLATVEAAIAEALSSPPARAGKA